MPTIHITTQEYNKIRNMNNKLPLIKELEGGSINDNQLFDVNDDHIRETLKLCYVSTVSEDTNFPVHLCFFTEESLDDVWGDDWDDTPYEHNSGVPNTPCLSILAVNVSTASSGHLNSPYSVEDINSRSTPWLTDENNNELYAGATVDDFIDFMTDSPNGIYL